MALSYTLRAEPLPPPKDYPRRVLITGAAGRIGSALAEYAHQKYALSLMVHSLDREAKALKPFGSVVKGDLGNLKQLKASFAGIDTVVHLAGEPDPGATWEDLLEENIIGAYHAMVAAKASGCRRSIYASSIHAVSGYPPDVQVKVDEPVNPGDLYGVTKCFGEALGRYLAGQENLSVIALRIGGFQPMATARDGSSLAMMSHFLSHRDMCQLICRCIDDTRLQFAIFNAVSDNQFKRLDISTARELVGFQPEDNFAEENPRLAPLHLEQATQPKKRKSGLRKEL